MASLDDDLAVMREREKAAATFETNRIAVSMQHVAEAFSDVYAPLQDDTRFLMETITNQIDEIRSRCGVVVEVCCGAAPCATLLAKLLPACSVHACDISVSALAAAPGVGPKTLQRMRDSAP